MARLSREGKPIEGHLKIEFVTDRIFRVRYAETPLEADKTSPMLVSMPPTVVTCKMREEANKVILKTPAISVTVILDPYRLEIKDAQGNIITGVGGAEKNFFHNWDAINTGVCRDAGEAPVATECFDIHPHEAVYGFGECFGPLNKVGQTIDLDIVDAVGTATPRSYKSIPLFLSTRGYGVFFHHSCLMRFYVGSRSACDLQAVLQDDHLDYFVMVGSMKEILHDYTALTGRGEMPPDWSFGFWQSKISYQAADETLEIARRFRKDKIPCDVIHLDTNWFKLDWYCDLTFNPAQFPDPVAYLKEMASLGIKISLWQLPYIPEGSDLFNELKAVDGFVKTATGEIYDTKVCFVKDFKGVTGCIDYTNPKAVKVHQDWFRKLFRMGVKVIKTDFGEGAPLDGVYHDGTPGAYMHNLYPLLYNKAVAEVTKEETGSAFVWARAAWAGNQRYPVHWGGDNSPNWFNIGPQIEGGLSLGLSGFQFWSHDMGGFLGDTGGTLLIRWLQLAMFFSHVRIHGMGKRELYQFDPEVIRIGRNYLRFRYRLLPYIMAESQDCLARSLPVARALVIEHPDDPNTWNIGDQWYFGNSLVVAPIMDESNRRMVYLPEGRWHSWRSGTVHVGGKWRSIAADLETLPMYVREGAVIPLGPEMEYVAEKPVDEIELVIAPYADKGETTYRFAVNGSDVTVKYELKSGKHQVTVPAGPVKFQAKFLGPDKSGKEIEVTTRK